MTKVRFLEDSPERLTIEDAPWFLGIFLIFVSLFGAWSVFNGVNSNNWVVSLAGLAFAAGGSFAFAKSVRRVRLTLDRGSGHATWTVRDWKGLSEQRWPLSDIGEAFVGMEEDDGPKFRIAFTVVSEDRAIPLTVYHSNLGNPGKVAARINAFLYPDQHEQESL